MLGRPAMPSTATHRPRRPRPGRAAAQAIRIGVTRFSAAHLLIALMLLFVALPIIERSAFSELIDAAAITAVVFFAGFAVGGSASSLAIAGILMAPVLIVKWIDHLLPGSIPPTLVPGSAALFMAFVAYKLLAFVVKAPQVTSEVVCAGISTYLILGLVWMFLYLLVDELSPGAFAMFGHPMTTFNRLDAFYFSFVTMVGIGYGDITPADRVAQMLAAMEGIIGMLFMVTVIARLVSAYTPHRGTEHAGHEGQEAS